MTDQLLWWTLLCGVPALCFGSGVLAAAFLNRTFVAVTVRGMSMEPTYRDGDRLLVRRDVLPAVGQIVVVAGMVVDHARPGVSQGWLIKRVAAVPGDLVPRDLVPRDRVPRDRVPALAHVPEDRVPAGKLVLLGDNPAVSSDSRQLGYFPEDRVLGTALHPLRRRHGW